MREDAPKEEGKPEIEKTPEPKAEAEASGELPEIQKKLREKLKDRMAGRKSKEEPAADDRVVKPGEKAPDKKDAKKEEKKVEPTEDKPAKIKVTPKKTHEEDLARAMADASLAAKTAMEMVSESKKPKPESKANDPMDSLPDEIRDQVPIFEVMEKRFPDKYKGIRDRYVKTAAKTMEYKANWEKENKGQKFNGTDEEHNDFFADNAVKWEERDYQRAIAAMESETVVAEERKRSEEKIRELEAKSLVGELEPAIRGRQAQVARGILKELDETYEGIITEDARLDKDKFEALKNSNPLAAKAIVSDLAPLAQFVRETEKLFHPSGHFKFDPANQVHQDIYEFAVAQEKAIKGLPSAQQLDADGRKFATKAEYDALSPERLDDYWTINRNTLIALKSQSVSGILKEKLKELDADFELVAKSKGFTKGPVAKPADGGKLATSTKSNGTNGKVETPSAAGESKTDTLNSGSNITPGDFRSSLKAVMRGHKV